MTDDSVRAATFVQTAAAAAAARCAFASRRVRVAGSDVIRVGLIGCGGRGTGAARDCLRRVRRRRARRARRSAARSARAVPRRAREGSGAETPRSPRRYKVTDERVLHRLRRLPEGARDRHRPRDPRDAARVPADASRGGGRGRQAHLRGEAGRRRSGRHPVGARDLRARASRRTSAIGVGTQRRHQAEYLATIKRIHDGAIGDVRERPGVLEPGRPLEPRDGRPTWTDTEWQIRNWLYFTWLSGDHIVEQHVHNIDVANWVLGAHPIKAVGVGGRQWRTDPEVRPHLRSLRASTSSTRTARACMSMCRQIAGTRRPGRRALHRHEGHVEHAVGQRDHGRQRVDVRARRRSRSARTCRSTPTSSRASARASPTTS